MANSGRVIIVHTLKDAIAALRIAAELQKPVTLQSAPDALAYAGSLYILNLFKQAKDAVPEAKCDFILDCADTAGLAIGALADGHKALRVGSDPVVAGKLSDIAAKYGATIYKNSPETLDLRQFPPGSETMRKWLLCD